MRKGISRALPKIFGALGGGVLVTGSFLIVPSLMQSAGATGTGTAGAPTTTHHVQPTYHTGNITSCPSGTTAFLITSKSATYSTDGTYFKVTVTSTGEYLDFTTNSSSFTVYVKGGPAYDSYDYTTTAYSSDTGLHAPLVGNGNVPTISHYVVCGERTIAKATPSLTTHASGPVTVGAAIHDMATLSGGRAPTGTITFKVYSTAGCHTPVAAFVTTGVTVTGTGTSTSASLTTTSAGTYYWTASYSGDTNNAAVTSPCGAATEASVVNTPTPTPTPATPKLSTTAGTEVAIGTSIHDTATLSGGRTPTGTITFDLYSTTACHTPVAAFVTTGVTVTHGNGTYSSATVTPTTAGTYYWTASYSGDAQNNPVTGPCGAPHESVIVRTTSPTTQAKTPKLKVVKSSTPSSGSTVAPSSTVTYTLSLTDSSTVAATDVTVTDAVPKGTTYKATSATCNGVTGCVVSESGGAVTWTGINVTGGETVSISFQVTVSASDQNGARITNFAVFTNEGTPTCTTSTCHTNTVTLTVVHHASASSTTPTPPTTTPTTPTAPPTPTRISAATTVHTGEPWAGSLFAELGVLGAGFSLLAVGEWLRRLRRPRHLRG